MTRERFDALVNSWDELGLGMNGGDAIPKLQSTQSNITLITSVTSIPPCLLPH